MLRKIIIMAMVALMTVPALGQSEAPAVNYAPQQGDVQVGVLFGTSNYFLTNHYNLLPGQVRGQEPILDDAQGMDNSSMRSYLNFGNVGSNSSTNMIGVTASYFLFDWLEFTGMFGMNINLTPQKDYVEAEYINQNYGNGATNRNPSITDLISPSYEYLDAESQHLFDLEIGSNYRFTVANGRISPYAGLFCGFQMARVEAYTPYTGNTVDDSDVADGSSLAHGDPTEIYGPSYRAGQAYGIRSGIKAGIEYAVMEGLILGLEVAPVLYQYSVVDIRPTGYSPWQADNHRIRIFSQPRLKLAFRF